MNKFNKERERGCVVAVDWVHGSLSSRGCLTNGNGPWRAVYSAEAMAECLPATRASQPLVCLWIFTPSLSLVNIAIKQHAHQTVSLR